MKPLLISLFALLALTAVQADTTYGYLLFKGTDGTPAALSVAELEMTVAGGQLVADPHLFPEGFGHHAVFRDRAFRYCHIAAGGWPCVCDNSFGRANGNLWQSSRNTQQTVSGHLSGEARQ